MTIDVCAEDTELRDATGVDGVWSGEGLYTTSVD